MHKQQKREYFVICLSWKEQQCGKFATFPSISFDFETSSYSVCFRANVVENSIFPSLISGSYAATVCAPLVCCHCCASKLQTFPLSCPDASNHPTAASTAAEDGREKKYSAAQSGAHFKAPKRLFNGCLHQIRKTITEFHIKFIASHSSSTSFVSFD